MCMYVNIYTYRIYIYIHSGYIYVSIYIYTIYIFLGCNRGHFLLLFPHDEEVKNIAGTVGQGILFIGSSEICTI